jgi:hypothetical protein
MYCPICKAEYREGFTRCSTCEVGLIPELFQTDENPVEEVAAILWHGNDPRTFADLKKVLDDADILYTTDYPTAYLLFPGMRSPFQIRVLSGDLEKAVALREDYFGPEEAVSETTPEQRRAMQGWLKSVGGADVPIYSSDDWNPEEATCEAWAGNDRHMAQIIYDCLRENGIGASIVSESDPLRVMIYPNDESGARKIIREIIEGTPSA